VATIGVKLPTPGNPTLSKFCGDYTVWDFTFTNVPAGKYGLKRAIYSMRYYLFNTSRDL